MDKKPTICLDDKCVLLTHTQDKESWESGHSFECWGKIEPHRVTGDGFTHVNDISHCVCTPGKGIIRFYENLDDQLIFLKKMIRVSALMGLGKINLNWLFPKAFCEIEDSIVWIKIENQSQDKEGEG